MEETLAQALAPAAPVAAAAPAAPVVPDAPLTPEPVVEATSEPFDLKMPDFLPLAQRTDEREQFVQEFSQIAPDAGIDASTAQGLVDMIIDSGTALTYEAADEYTTAEDAFATMEQTFGPKVGRDLVNSAQKYVASLGPKVADFLDRSGMGNDVATLVSLALAQSGVFKLTPAAAQAEIETLMKTKEYMQGDKLTVIRLHTLSRIMGRDEASPTTKSGAALQGEATARAAAKATETAKGEARSAAMKMLSEKDGPLLNSGHRNHEKAVETYRALLARL